MQKSRAVEAFCSRKHCPKQYQVAVELALDTKSSGQYLVVESWHTEKDSCCQESAGKKSIDNSHLSFHDIFRFCEAVLS